MELWILWDKLQTQQNLKIIWRIADSSPGPLQIVALGPHGLRVLPSFSKGMLAQIGTIRVLNMARGSTSRWQAAGICMLQMGRQ